MNKKLLLVILFIVSVFQTVYATLPPSTSPVYHLQSNPGCAKVIYLDFDGQFVNSTSWKNNNTNFPGQPINALASNVDENDIITIWKTIREDYMPFDVNVTTDSVVYQQAVYGKRQMCIFTPSYEWSGQLGVTLGGSFSYDEPCFAFTAFNKGKAAAEVGSHELGHTFGLSHDGTTYPYSDYFYGQGTDPHSWSAIMGGAHVKSVIQWSKGEYPYANNQQDDMSIIANILGYKTDEAGSNNATAKRLVTDASGTVYTSTNTGVITTAADIDVYSFTTSGGNVILNVAGAPNNIGPGGAITSLGNLDILLQLKDASNTVLATSDDQNSLLGSISMSLVAGTYYLYIDGTGYSTTTTGYTDYGSVGEYIVSGSIPIGTDQAPVVTVTDGIWNFDNPDNYFTPRTGGGFIIAASAIDPDGTITGLKFYNGNTLIASTYYTPYSIFFSSSIAGLYTITVKGTDNFGNETVSKAVTIDIFEPNVQILSPASMTNVVEGANVSILGFADVQYSRYIDNVKYYDGTTLLSTNTSYLPPYNYNLTSVGAGIHIIKMVATMSYYTNVTSQATITITAAPPQPGNFTNYTPVVCKGRSAVKYAVPSASGATYIWTYTGQGMSITSGDGTNSILVDFSGTATSGTLSVMAVKNGVASASKDVPITVNSVPDMPSGIAGMNTPLSGSIGNLYSITSVSGVLYVWSFSGTGGTITGAGNSIALDLASNATPGDLTVVPSNACGSGSASMISLIPTTLPSSVHQPGAFTTFKDTVCNGSSSITYAVPLETGAMYNWSYSGDGMSIVSGNTTNSIVVNFSSSATSGTLSVQAIKSGIVSPVRDLMITVNSLPGTLSAISGSNTIVAGSSRNAYLVTPLDNVSYIWTFSGTGITIHNSGSSATLDVAASATNGNLTVLARNGCSSTASLLALTVAQPITVTTGSLKTDQSVSIQVKPNPSSGAFTINVSQELKVATVKIVDVYGRTVYESILPEDGFVNLNSVTSGTYAVIVQKDQYRVIERIIIQ